MRRVTVLALMTFVAAALLATYPLVRRPADTIAVSLADPIILTTVLAWDADRLLHGLHGLWDPPFLYPRHRRSPTPSTCSASRFSPHRSSGCSATPC